MKTESISNLVVNTNYICMPHVKQMTRNGGNLKIACSTLAICCFISPFSISHFLPWMMRLPNRWTNRRRIHCGMEPLYLGNEVLCPKMAPVAISEHLISKKNFSWGSIPPDLLVCMLTCLYVHSYIHITHWCNPPSKYPAYGPECSIAVMAKYKQVSLLRFVQEERYWDIALV